MNHKQTDESGIFYTMANYDINGQEVSAGIGINLWNWFGIEVGKTSGNDFYLTVSFTPWLSSSISIGASGITSTFGFNIGATTHELSITIGWGLTAIVVGVAAGATLLTAFGGKVITAIAYMFSTVFA